MRRWNRRLAQTRTHIRSHDVEDQGGSGSDVLGLVADQVSAGLVPPDPDRPLATGSQFPTDTALVVERAQLTARAAESAAEGQAYADLEQLDGDAAGFEAIAERHASALDRLETRQADLSDAQRVYDEQLRPLAYMKPNRGEGVRYYTTQALLGLADVGTIAAGAVNVLGDPLPLAVMQGVGVGVANVSVGQLGAVLRDRRERANRPHQPSESAAAFLSWHGPDHGAGHSTQVLGVGALAVLLTFLGQFAWRALFDGSAIGLTYAAFAVVVVAGSLVNSYIHGGLDEVQRYKHDLDHETHAVRIQVDELVNAEIRAAALRAEAATHRRSMAAHGVAVGEIARAEALGLMISQPNIYGTHDPSISSTTSDRDWVDDAEPRTDADPTDRNAPPSLVNGSHGSSGIEGWDGVVRS